MRVPVLLATLIGLSACGSSAPVETSGPGFTDYNTYLDQRAAEAAAAGEAAAAAAAQASAQQTTASTGFSTDVIAGAIDEADGVSAGLPLDPMQTGVISPDPLPGALVEGQVITEGARPRGDAPTNIQAQSGEVQDFVSGGVSDEQDFAAVAARETIESDAARINANRAQYVVIQPGSLPVRPGDTGPNIVEFALATTNPVGVALYDRGGIAFTNSDKACSKFASPDQAQQAFLAAGGPDSDRKNLDPDGDGFACSWDPTSFRIALQ
jgi:hypothetical protein